MAGTASWSYESPPGVHGLIGVEGVTNSIVSATIVAAAITGAVSVLLWAINAVVGGHRERLARQREEFAKAFATCVSYEEFPYVVRRRRTDVPQEERARISRELREVQEKLAYYSAWLATEASRVSAAYTRLVAKLREVAGGQIHEAWLAPPGEGDAGMNMPDLGLGALKPFKEAYLLEVADHLSVIPRSIRRAARRLSPWSRNG
jgi:hypothetical protein